MVESLGEDKKEEKMEWECRRDVWRKTGLDLEAGVGKKESVVRFMRGG